MQILTVLPRVKQPIVHREGEVRCSKLLEEPLRRLHATLQLANVHVEDRQGAPRTILFISADRGDGKSTVAAGLALVQREAGQRVAVVEADFRRPVQAKLLAVDGTHGLADVLAGTLPLDGAMQQVQRARPAVSKGSVEFPAGGVTTMIESSEVGSLSLLAGGIGVTNPPALLARAGMAELLRSLAEEHHHVLIDAPPPLLVSDVLPLLRIVDGIVIIARLKHTRAVSAERLSQLMTRTSSAPVLGVVANAVSRADMKKAGLSSSYATGRRRLLG
jgi:succinoglycan biosynthesis transport protein ExoP